MTFTLISSIFSCECLVNSKIPVSLFNKLESRLRKYLHGKPLRETKIDLNGDEVLAATIESLNIVEESTESLNCCQPQTDIVSSDIDIVIDNAQEDQQQEEQQQQQSYPQSEHRVLKIFLYKYPDDEENEDQANTNDSKPSSNPRTLINAKHHPPIDGESEFYSLETFPNSTYSGLWESLEFDSSIKSMLLAYVTAIFKFSLVGLTEAKEISFNRILLLHGPPGTGKTTLAKALVFKLSTRLHALQHNKSASQPPLESYDKIQCVTVHANQLFSRWFSESGKSVQKLFETIKGLAQVPGNFVCVLIDEVESLAMSRKQSADSGSSEPTDSIRTVNTLLTQIDLTRNLSNIVYLATSNFPSLIDEAFLDRVDWMFKVSLPSQKVIYSLLLESIKALHRKDLIKGSEELASSAQSAQLIGGISKDLFELSLKLHGQSGRAIKRLPLMAYASFLNRHPKNPSSMSISEFIQIMHELQVK